MYGHVGLVLAAGASRRMGQPKALLPLPDGRCLAQAQVEALLLGGCSEVLLVTGAHAQDISQALPSLATLFNPDWREGRMTSVRAGLQARPGARGYLLLPVDAALMQTDTVAQILSRADLGDCAAIRPCVAGRNGYALWLSPTLAKELLETPPDPEDRLDVLVQAHAVPLPVSDPALLRNLNTPGEWRQFFDTQNAQKS